MILALIITVVIDIMLSVIHGSSTLVNALFSLQIQAKQLAIIAISMRSHIFSISFQNINDHFRCHRRLNDHLALFSSLSLWVEIEI